MTLGGISNNNINILISKVIVIKIYYTNFGGINNIICCSNSSYNYYTDLGGISNNNINILISKAIVIKIYYTNFGGINSNICSCSNS